MTTISRRIFGALLGLCVLSVIVPGVRADETAEDPDERRLPGTVLAEQAVNGAPVQRQVDVVVGEDARKGLRDPREFDDRRR